MRYRGGGIGHRSLWPLRDVMMAEGHLRPGQEQTSESHLAEHGGDQGDDETSERDGRDCGGAEDEEGMDEDSDDDDDDDDSDMGEGEGDREVGENEDEYFDEVEDCGYYFEDDEADEPQREVNIDVAVDF